MAKFPTYEDMSKKVAEKALDEFLYDNKSIREWMQIIASEDAISRQAVLEIVRDMHGLARADVLSHTINQIEKLPPTTPKPKTGHWVYDEVCSDWYDTVYKCSCCERRVSFSRICEAEDGIYKNYPYCHCGAKMVRPQESEDE